jgi:putative sugar O-methyltransferase
MEDYFVNEGLLIYSSNFWNDWNQTNIEQLTTFGLDHFKQTVAGNYFTWKVDINHPYAQNLKQLVPKLNVMFSHEELNRKHLLWTQQESTNYNTITMYYLNYMLNLGWGGYIDQLEEPLVGNPPYSIYNGKRVSQDIFNSLLEYLSVAYACPMHEVSSIGEIGAGYGRTAYCFLKFHPEKKYIIIDFPPALYVSQEYLTSVFPEKKVMRFRPFKNFKDIEREFNDSDLVFLTPDQLSTIPNGSIDLFLAIDCLHEMKAERIVHYFNEAQRLSSYFYYKCWVQTYVGPDNVYHLENSYPVKKHWKQIFKLPCEIPSGFFHAMYKLN